MMDRHPEACSAELEANGLPEAIRARYRIDGRLGRGSMGMVYQACDLRLDRPVALKALPPTASHGVEDREREARFLREARLAARLTHPNIVTIYDILQEEGRWFLVMELLVGLSFRQILDDQERVSPEQARSWIAQAARALDVAHRADVVHRDIKPENLLVQADGRVRIMDFGIAVAAGQPRLTRDGWMMGTPAYLAPELLNGGRPDPRSDLFALGVVLYELITGVNPYAGGAVTEVLRRIVSGPPPALSDLCPDVPPALAAIVDRLLCFNPSDRYASAAELVIDLETVGLEPERTAVSMWRTPSPGRAPAPQGSSAGTPKPLPLDAAAGTAPLPLAAFELPDDYLPAHDLPASTAPEPVTASSPLAGSPPADGRRPAPRPPRWYRPALAALGAAAVALILVVVCWKGASSGPAVRDAALLPGHATAAPVSAGTTPSTPAMTAPAQAVPGVGAQDLEHTATGTPVEPTGTAAVETGYDEGGVAPAAQPGAGADEMTERRAAVDPAPVDRARARVEKSASCVHASGVQAQMKCLEASLSSPPAGSPIPQEAQQLLLDLLEVDAVRQRGLVLAPRVVSHKALAARMQQWLKRRDVSLRWAAAETLAVLGRPVPESELRRLDLSDQSCPVRRDAALYFVENPNAAARPDLEQALERSVTQEVAPTSGVVRLFKKTKKVAKPHCDHEALVEALAALPRS